MNADVIGLPAKSTLEVSSPAQSPASGLRRRSLKTFDLVFFIVAPSAPLTVVAGGQTVAYLVTGNPGFLLLLLLLLLVVGVVLLFTMGYAAMSSRIVNAGAFHAYV